MAFAVDLTGTILDRRYRLTGLLGKGGMGYVYEAVHMALDQRVAVKVLHPRYAYEEKFRERFLQEARAASKIRHPNVVEIKDFGDTPDGSVYFAMEYLQGHDVGAELQEHGAMPWSRTRHILLQAANALHAAHTKHIIHRDIKPGNCFLITDEAEDLRDEVKLLDFGIAKVGSDSHADAQGKGLTGTGEVFGTASYMSPEQARGQALDARSDIYSLGIMAYEMLVGQVPFTGVNAIHVITQHLRDRPEPLRTYDARIPEAVEAVVLKMLAKEPRDRFGSMAEVEQALQEIPADAGPRRTRLWSSPGELRALVAAKKAGEGAPRASGADALRSNPITSTAAVETDAERTAAVLPKSAAGRGVVKRTVVSGERPPSPRARDAPAGAGASGRAAAPVPASAPPGAPARVPAPAAASKPATTQASSSEPAKTPAAPVRAGAPAGVPAPAAAPTPAMEPTPSPVPTTTPRAATAPAPAATPVPVAAEPAVGSPVPAVAAPLAQAPAFGAVPPTASAAHSPGVSGTGPQPNILAPASSRPGWPIAARADGTNPPPGHDTSASTWPPSTGSTGPIMRLGDTGTETRLHSLEVDRAQGLSARLLLVVGLLFLLVVGASVLGTMAFLSQREGPEPAPAESEPKPAVDDTVPVGRGADGAEPPGAPEARVNEAAAVLDGGGASNAVSSPVEGVGTEGDDVEEPGTAGIELDTTGADEPSEPVQPEEQTDQPGESDAPAVPKHETAKCVRARESASLAIDRRKWTEAAKLARQRDCWPAAEQTERRRIQVNALLELGQFEDCIAAGSKTTDPVTRKWVETCRKRLATP